MKRLGTTLRELMAKFGPPKPLPHSCSLPDDEPGWPGQIYVCDTTHCSTWWEVTVLGTWRVVEDARR